jgi:hypothetical protein
MRRNRPANRRVHTTGRTHLNMMGRGIWDNIVKGVKGALAELKRGKYISNIGRTYAKSGLPGSNVASMIGETASKFGYGRKRRVGRPRKMTSHKKRGGMVSLAGGARKKRYGRGVRLAGSGTSLAGGRLKKKIVFP